jgi:hypothetical protein
VATAEEAAQGGAPTAGAVVPEAGEDGNTAPDAVQSTDGTPDAPAAADGAASEGGTD